MSREMNNSIYLDGEHEGWVINLLGNGIQVISPGIGEIEITQKNSNTVEIHEEPQE